MIKKTWKKISHTDGVNFLVARANELVVGGTLLMVNVNSQKAGESTVYEIMDEVLYRWVKERKLRQSESDEILIPAYHKSAEEWRECFEDKSVKVTGLKLQRIEQGVAAENPYFQNHWDSTTSKLDSINKFMKWFLAFGLQEIILRTLRTDDKLNEFIREVGEILASKAEQYELCNIAYYSDFYVAVKE